MVILLRIFLVGLIVYLIVRSFFLYGKKDNDQVQGKRDRKVSKKISKDTGEYIDYEEIKK